MTFQHQRGRNKSVFFKGVWESIRWCVHTDKDSGSGYEMYDVIEPGLK